MIKFIMQMNLLLIYSSISIIFFLLIFYFIHPILIILIMIFFNMILFYYISLWKSNFLYSIILFLIMISGLLIIFLYFSSLISNEKISSILKLNYLIFMYSISMNLILIFYLNEYNYFFMDFNFSEINSLNLIITKKFFNVINMYMYPMSNFTILSIFFIIFSFITIIKINSLSISLSMRKII